MRSYVIPETFFKALLEKPKLYSRVWFYWLSNYADGILEPTFIEKLEVLMPKTNFYTIEEIKEIYKFGLRLLQEGNFKICDEEVLTKKPKKEKHTEDEKAMVEKVIEYLNVKAGSTFTSKAGTTTELIVARLREGYTYSDFVFVIDTKCDDWLISDWQKYLRPLTLFNKTKFETYLNTNKNGIAKPTTKFDNLIQAVNEAKGNFNFNTN